ncbi:DUF2318 domain-containing protein [Patescibacteria group bacterium]|nr:DUF2318 domain-containing protein [Patescibacteria group bacterium]
MKNKKILILGLCLFLIIAIFTKGFGLFKSNSNNQIPNDQTPVGPDDFINIVLSDITDNARWYEYDLGSSKIKFFAVKASDGTVKTGFDACDVCYTEKKGYRQEGDYMVCKNCGNRYPIDGLGTENKTPGGCWPGYLSNVIEGDNILIKKSDLESNQWRTL